MFRPVRNSTFGFGRRLMQQLHRRRRYALALSWLIIPILVMSLPRDKQDRYLLPLLPAAAVIAGRGCVAAAAGARRGWRAMSAWFGVQVVLVVIAALAAPIAGMTVLRTGDGAPWYSMLLGSVALAAAVFASMLMFWIVRRSPLAVIGAGGTVILATAALLLWGYKDAPDGRAEHKPLADQVRALRPGAAVAYFEPHKQPRPAPSDLAIYMNQATPTIRAEHGKTPSIPENQWPAILVVLQREQEQPPEVPGWRILKTVKYGKRTWHALERK
jgi:4-amino-4-deoxy-L-arabinose transferase-like glycosyltransferase